jgi:hypothetical protein
MTNESTRSRTTRRLIAVGVGAGEAASAALAWAAAEARPGDAVHVVHAYTPLSLDGSSWAPVAQAKDDLRAHARLVVARATTALRASHPQIEIDGSAIEAAPLAALADMSRIVDLVVVGASAPGGSATPARDARLGWSLADQSSCPVVIVPPATDPGGKDRCRRPVALLLGASSLPPHAVEFAFEAAARRHVTLVVCESRSPGPTGLPVTADNISRWETTRQETLDADLSPWQENYHAAGVIVELRREGAVATAALMHRTSQLLVVARECPAGTPLDTLARAALRHAMCPVAIVPDTTVTTRCNAATAAHRHWSSVQQAG